MRPAEETLWSRDFLSGYWGGFRERLYKKGLDVTLAFIGETWSTVDGGRKEDTANNEVGVISFDFYPHKNGKSMGGQVHNTYSLLLGPSAQTQNVGSLNTIYYSDAPADAFRMFELWYGQKFKNNTLEVRAGKIYPWVLLGACRSSCLFSNGAFNYPSFLGFGLQATYFAAPLGVMARWNARPDVVFIAQVQDGYDDEGGGFANKNGIKVKLGKTEGAEATFEGSYRPNQLPKDTGYPGNYRFGVQLHTGKFFDRYTNAAGGPLGVFGGDPKQVTGDYAVYFIGEQQVSRESALGQGKIQGLTLFGKVGAAPKSVNTISFYTSVGSFYQGLIPKRNWDVVGLAFAYSKVSDAVQRFEADRQRNIPDRILPDYEGVLEFTYSAEITPWWMFVLDLQRILHPGGSRVLKDATVVGLSLRIGI